MTSSETPTNRESGTEGGTSEEAGLLGGLDWRRAERLVMGVLCLVGAVVILEVNGWRLTAPVIFLFMGWIGILVSIAFLWRSGMAAALEDDEDDDVGFEVASTRHDDLLREKRAVLKAIKEIEFDYAMDKMSRKDADDLTAMYRRRGIAIIKELEGGDAGSVSEIIDREIRARLAVTDVGPKSGPGKKSKAASGDTDATEDEVDDAASADPDSGGDDRSGEVVGKQGDGAEEERAAGARDEADEAEDRGAEEESAAGARDEAEEAEDRGDDEPEREKASASSREGAG